MAALRAAAVILGCGAGLLARMAPGVAAPAPAGAATAEVVALDDEIRLRRADTSRARALGRPLAPAGGEVELAAFRGETVAVQIAVLAGAAPVRELTISLAGFPDGVAGPRAEIFREHYLSVRTRSRNDRHPAESLGWSAGARPADDDMLGEIPDALLPIGIDPSPVTSGPAIPAQQTGAFWIDVDVPEMARAGTYEATAEVAGDGAVLARFRLRLQVAATPLPYRATSVFAFYEADRLEGRIGGTPDPVERQLWRLLHAHHVDALAPLSSGGDVRRLAAVYDGSLFAGSGPDEPAHAAPAGAATVPPAVVALGAYGALGGPRAESLKRVDEMLAALPPVPATLSAKPPGGIADVFVYAIDETCASPRAGDWKRALAGHATPRPLLVGQTCNDPPERQSVDVALVIAEAFTRGLPEAARAAGRRAWIYNGFLPHTGTLLLDADPRGLIANGWIAAVMAIPRWFYWETIFWDDSNRGGHGPIDPFTTAEGFHNRDGDSALGDGLLLYPGRQQGRFAARSLGYEGVLPSLRLKMIRRGIEDAGIIALAAREHPADTARIITQALPAALDEAPADRPASWQGAPLRFTEARAALRRLVGRAEAMNAAEIDAAFADQAVRRRELVPLAAPGSPIRRRRLMLTAGLGLATAILIAFALVRKRLGQARSPRPN